MALLQTRAPLSEHSKLNSACQKIPTSVTTPNIKGSQDNLVASEGVWPGPATVSKDSIEEE
jgi:hypothetical protein